MISDALLSGNVSSNEAFLKNIAYNIFVFINRIDEQCLHTLSGDIRSSIAAMFSIIANRFDTRRPFFSEYDKRQDQDRTRFQKMAFEWAVSCFSYPDATNYHERACRFIEEALELVQSLGVRKDEIYALTSYVYNRPSGNPHKEAGDVLLTLAILSSAISLSLEDAGVQALDNCWANFDRIRAKHLSKPRNSPLPGVSE